MRSRSAFLRYSLQIFRPAVEIVSDPLFIEVLDTPHLESIAVRADLLF